MSKGHERIGFISWPEGFRIGDMRTRGYLETMQIADCPFAITGLLTRLTRWSRHFRPPSKSSPASRAHRHRLRQRYYGLRCEKVYRIARLEIGTDIALTGYDDTPVAELIGLTRCASRLPSLRTTWSNCSSRNQPPASGGLSHHRRAEPRHSRSSANLRKVRQPR